MDYEVKMPSFGEWLESLDSIEMDSDYGDTKNKKLLSLDKTMQCLKSKLENAGVPVRFRLVSQGNRGNLPGGLRSATQAKPGVLTICRDDSLQHPLTCWMMLHQVGHAMEQSMNGSNEYRRVDGLIREWWKEYHKILMSESDNYYYDDSNDDRPEPPRPNNNRPVAPPPPPPPKKETPQVNFADPSHRQQFRNKVQAGGNYYLSYLYRNPAMAHMVFSKFLAFKSARDSWKSFSQSFHQGHIALDRVAQFGTSGTRAAYTADDELLNELVAEYLWHGKIRYVNDPNDPFVKQYPDYIPTMLENICNLIKEGLKKMEGEVIAIG